MQDATKAGNELLKYKSAKARIYGELSDFLGSIYIQKSPVEVLNLGHLSAAKSELFVTAFRLCFTHRKKTPFCQCFGTCLGIYNIF